MKQSLLPQVPGSFESFRKQNLENSERAPGHGCPPGTEMLRTPSFGAAGSPIDDPAVGTGTGAIRVNIAGGVLHSLITPDNIHLTERVWRKNAVQGVLTAAPSSPFVMELGAFIVPKNMAFCLLDYRFAVYAPSAIPGDTYELDDGQLSTHMGWDITFSDKHPDNNQYELEPSNPTGTPAAYATNSNAGIIPGNGLGGTPGPEVFNTARANQFAGPSGPGLATLPQRHRRTSQLDMPFTHVVESNQRVVLKGVVWRALPFPVSFFQGEITGFLVNQNVIEKFLRGIPTNTKSAG